MIIVKCSWKDLVCINWALYKCNNNNNDNNDNNNNNNNNNKCKYSSFCYNILLGQGQQAHTEASEEFTKQMKTDFHDVYEGIRCFKITISIPLYNQIYYKW